MEEASEILNTDFDKFQKFIDKYDAKWQGSITYEQIIDYLEVAKGMISVPLLIIGIDL